MPKSSNVAKCNVEVASIPQHIQLNNGYVYKSLPMARKNFSSIPRETMARKNFASIPRKQNRRQQTGHATATMS